MYEVIGKISRVLGPVVHAKGVKHAQMLELALATEQSLHNLAQALGLGQLAEKHPHELIPTTKAFRTAFSAKGLGGRGELVAIDQG